MLYRRMAVALATAALASSAALAQNSQNGQAVRDTTPATRFEQFSSKKGRLLMKTSYQGAEVRNSQGPIRVRGVALGEPGDSNQVFAVVFESEGRGTYARASSAVLDFDEAVSLVQAIDRMKTIAGEMGAAATQPYTEVLFETKSDFQAGFYQSEGKQGAFVRLERFGTDGVRFGDIKLLDDLRSSVSGVVDQLRSVGAK